MSARLESELKLLDQYNNELDALKDQLAQADPQASKNLQRQIDQKLAIYWKQIGLVKTQYPDAEIARMHEAAFYTFQALTRLLSTGTLRRVSSRSSNMAVGIATGLIAKQQEKGNAHQALAILDQALGVFDYPGARLAKAEIYRALNQNEDALRELNYIIANFQDDDSYVAARQLKDEIETPAKKGMCFIATAAYGSPLAPDVVVLSRFRDAVLLRSRPGRGFVAVYYFVSPPLAALIAKAGFLRVAARRLLLAPLVRILKVLNRSL
jgi:tetratricopeptide (TPR) repeat protein